MGDYAQAIRNALGKTQTYMPTMPSISFTDPYTGTLGEGGFISTVTPYIIWGLLITFVILLVLVIVHYTIRPIFNFGNNPVIELSTNIVINSNSNWYFRIWW
jgi:hypothetical protein